MILTSEDIVRLLEFIKKAEGRSFGWSDNLKTGALEAKLSIMLEMAAKQEKMSLDKSKS